MTAEETAARAHAAAAAVAEVADDMLVGLGTGSTASFVVARIGEEFSRRRFHDGIIEDIGGDMVKMM